MNDDPMKLDEETWRQRSAHLQLGELGKEQCPYPRS
jgi:hypothetical protein